LRLCILWCVKLWCVTFGENMIWIVIVRGTPLTPSFLYCFYFILLSFRTFPGVTSSFVLSHTFGHYPSWSWEPSLRFTSTWQRRVSAGPQLPNLHTSPTCHLTFADSWRRSLPCSRMMSPFPPPTSLCPGTHQCDSHHYHSFRSSRLWRTYRQAWRSRTWSSRWCASIVL